MCLYLLSTLRDSDKTEYAAVILHTSFCHLIPFKDCCT
jgi:hypothetical protein